MSSSQSVSPRESFERQTPAKRSNAPLSSPSKRRPPASPPICGRPDAADQDTTQKKKPAPCSTSPFFTILPPAGIIRELIENALDAGATRIAACARGKGVLDSITISDNSQGISPSDYESLCVASTTSKGFSSADLAKPSLFESRGEALSSICAIAKSTTVTTRTADSTIATTLKYAKNGSLADQGIAARPVGTTVQVENVFHALPLRQEDTIRRHTGEVGRCVAIVRALALISVNTRIDLKIGGVVKISNLLATEAPKDIPPSLGNVCLAALRDNAKIVLGERFSKGLIEVTTDEVATVNIPPDVQTTIQSDRMAESESPDTVAAYGCHGLVSKASLDGDGSGGRAKSSHQYIFVNRRPVDFPRLIRRIKDLYRRVNRPNAGAPVVILNLVLPAWSCNAKHELSKRGVCVHEEDKLIAGIVSLLEGIWLATETATVPAQEDSNLTFRAQSSPSVDIPDSAPSQPSVDVEMVDTRDELDADDFTDVPHIKVNSQDSGFTQGDGIIASEASEDTRERSEVGPLVTPPDARHVSLSPVLAVQDESTPDKAGSSIQSVPSQGHLRDSVIHATLTSAGRRDVSSFVERRSKSIPPEKRPPPNRFVRPDPNEPAEEEADKSGEEADRSEEDSDESEEDSDESEEEDIEPEIVYDKPRTNYPRPVAIMHVDWELACRSFETGEDLVYQYVTYPTYDDDDDDDDE